MHTSAVIFERPGKLVVDTVEIADPGVDDVVVDVLWSGISTGTERLLWNGDMPTFPGMGYPLVPGYEAVGTIVDASPKYSHRIGEGVYVPGSSAYKDVRGLFGGSAATLVVNETKAKTIDPALGADAVLMALTATAYHAIVGGGGRAPELIIGHGVLGRLMARLTLAIYGTAPVVWETNKQRAEGGDGYTVINPADDIDTKYSSIYDVSGDSGILDSLVAKLAPAGEIVLAGFYSKRLDFAFAPAFMREARIRVAAEWLESDLDAVRKLLEKGQLSLANLITHEVGAADAAAAYETAFGDPSCLKMLLNWSDMHE